MEQSEENTGIEVEETIGDAAYGDGGTRQAFADAGRTLIAKVPGRPNKAHFPKQDFQIDLGGHPDQPVGRDLPGTEFSIRPGSLWRMPSAVSVRSGERR